jgi:NADH dehydrogenase
VFAGAGFAGVETLAELHELTAGALRRHPRLAGVEPRWVLVDRAPRILGQTPETLARFAARTLSRRGVEILTETGARVGRRARRAAVGRPPDRDRDRRVDRRRHAQPAARQLGLPLDSARPRARRRDARGRGMEGVWALGDGRRRPERRHPGETDPATCQHALRQARRLARNLRGAAKPYRYRTRGQMATLGSRHGIATAGALRFRGLDGWVVARGYHLMALPFASRRARVLGDWASSAMFRRDVVEVI